MKELRKAIILMFLFGFCHEKALGEEYEKGNHNCTVLKNKFSTSTTSFITCSIANAEPVTYCQKCGNDYSSVVNKYNELLNTSIPNNETCRSIFFDKDRLNLIESIFLKTSALWQDGSCSNCYDWVEGSEKQNKSKTTLEFFSYLKEFQNCANTPDEICERCVDAYNKMNKTRLHWSHDLNCCKDRKSSLTAFIVTGTFIGCVFPFMFYSGFMFFGWRRRQEEFLTDTEPETSTQAQQAALIDQEEERLLSF